MENSELVVSFLIHHRTGDPAIPSYENHYY